MRDIWRVNSNPSRRNAGGSRQNSSASSVGENLQVAALTAEILLQKDMKELAMKGKRHERQLELRKLELDTEARRDSMEEKKRESPARLDVEQKRETRCIIVQQDQQMFSRC